jgi:hypothetical protein
MHSPGNVVASVAGILFDVIGRDKSTFVASG